MLYFPRAELIEEEPKFKAKVSSYFQNPDTYTFLLGCSCQLNFQLLFFYYYYFFRSRHLEAQQQGPKNKMFLDMFNF